MKTDIERFLAWCGLCVSFGGYFSSLLGLLSDPLYVFVSLVIGVCLAGWNCYVTETDVEMPVGFSSEVTNKRSPTERKRSRLIFGAAIFVFAIAAIVDGFSYFDIVDVRPVVQTSRALVPRAPDEKEDDVPRAVCQPLHNQYSLTSIAITATEVVSLTLSKRPRVPYAQVEKVELVVESYEPEPPVDPAAAASTERPPLIYLANIDESVTKGEKVFPAKRLDFEISDSPIKMIETDPITLIEDRKPTRLIVKVNAEVGGLYQYRLRIRFRHLWQTQDWRSEPRTVRFIKFRSDYKATTIPLAEADPRVPPPAQATAPAPP